MARKTSGKAKKRPRRARTRAADAWSDLARDTMKRKGLIPFGLAAETKIHPSIVGRWYNGERHLSLVNFAKVCERLGLTLVELPGPQDQ